ncbi:hypothetical protein RGR602_PB00439 (plasmid) [Rhizobium gallicum bv. gallicum R602sp]|uniref:Uncharacterized protein n=1 Tax=Rhizobium gallicum bv. gallicum R602sp TaxID=1041138 RepID=A0A0B4XBK2_9HYPH|nr:hypothetical protein RGR602_PB00439 [Rhizobium gallicum bv. gallicum R602sp]TDW16223.1 hypothetical protein EV128_13918 [Rhizobium azibense]
MRSGAITPTPTPAAGTVSRETLYKWMSDAGLWLSRKQRRTSYQLRLRREAFGELLQKAVHGRRLFEHDSIATVDLCGSGQICVARHQRSKEKRSYYNPLCEPWSVGTLIA